MIEYIELQKNMVLRRKKYNHFLFLMKKKYIIFLFVMKKLKNTFSTKKEISFAIRFIHLFLISELN
jgi:hypothetical protein